MLMLHTNQGFVTDRKSVVQGKSVDLGGRRIIKKKNKRKEKEREEEERRKRRRIRREHGM